MHESLPKRVIVFCLPGIGDAVLFTPALAALRRALPDAHITAVTMFQGTADVLQTNPDLDEVRQFDFAKAGKLKGLRYVWSLRCEGFDLSIMPFPSNRIEYNLVNRLVGRRWRAAHRYQHQSGRNLSFLNNISTTETGEHHNVEENLRLIRAISERLQLAGPDGDAALKLILTADDEAYGAKFLADHDITPDTPLIGLHTFSSTFKNMHRKCWDKDNFVRLIAQLSQTQREARFLIFSGPSDEIVNRYIEEKADHRVLLVRESNLRRAVAILKHCRVLVSNDSGLMHLGAAVGVPVVALFGPTNWRRLHPWTQRHIVVHQDLPCMPCFYYSSRPLRCVANLDYACMRDISVDEVFQAVQNLLVQSHVKETARR